MSTILDLLGRTGPANGAPDTVHMVRFAVYNKYDDEGTIIDGVLVYHVQLNLHGRIVAGTSEVSYEEAAKAALRTLREATS